MRSLLPAAALLAAAAVAVGCSKRDASSDNPDAALRVVATTTQVADFARAVGGDRVSVDALLSPNSDPHDYEPKPSDARAVAEADVVLRSGGDLDAWLQDVIQGAGGDATEVTLIDAVDTIEGGHHHEEGEEEHGAEEEHAGEEQDPHWWQDPRNVVKATEAIRAAFAKADPDGAGGYASGAREYTAQLTELDGAVERCMAAIPAGRRKLVTNHDAFGYFAHRYDITVLGSIIPALSTSAQPSAGDVRRLVAAIKRERVTTIFPESAINQRLEDAVARDAGAKVGPALFADTLGPKGSPGATYLGALRHDASAMATGFGGSCTDLP
jgi:ABC-type Zn uptake system ZnuABC Zn-binding protein ZnuA